MERKSTKNILAAGLALTLCVALAATLLQAEQSRQQQWQQSQRQQQQPRQQQDMSLQAEPMGWVRIAYDYDNDGYVDAYEYIYADDLMRAKQQSAQRQGPSGQMGRQMQQGSRQMQPRQQVDAQWQFDQPQGFRQQRQQPMSRRQQMDQQQMDQQRMGQQRMGQPRMIQTSGTIEELRQVKLYGQQDHHVVAVIETDADQTRVVDLGPRSQLRSLQLQSGDEIQVTGTRGTINNNPVIMADQIRSNGESLRVRRTWNRNDFRLSGEVVRTINRTLPGDRQPHTIALVETIQGSRYPVDLGARQKLDEKNIDISEGQDITLIVQPAQAGGQRILEAKKISIDDQVFQRNL